MAQLICVFDFAYAKSRFSHDVANMAKYTSTCIVFQLTHLILDKQARWVLYDNGRIIFSFSP